MIAADIAQEAHKHCSDPHNWDMHIFTSSRYAAAINDNGLQVTPKQVVDAIIALAGDPEKGEWTRHPHPDKVIGYLNDGPVNTSSEG